MPLEYLPPVEKHTYAFILRLVKAYEFERTVLVEAGGIVEATAKMIEVYGGHLVSYSVHEIEPFDP